MRRRAALGVLGAVLFLAACSASEQSSSKEPLYTHTTAAPRETTVHRAPAKLPQILPPATFVTASGDLPRESLTLREDGVFFSRMLQRDREKQLDLGRWNFSDDGKRILLYGGSDEIRQYEVESATTLLPLDGDGKAHEPVPERRLARADLLDPIRDTMRFVGMAVHLADAPFFTECHSQLRLPLAMERGYSEFESSYLENRTEPGSALLVSFIGHLEERPAADRTGTEEVLVAERFERAWPGQPCPTKAEFHASLRNTRWRLVEVLGQLAYLPPGGVEPHLVLDPSMARAGGSLGCQDFTCSFEQEASHLRFGGLAKSRTRCEGAWELESAFEKALQACTSYRIDGETLYLYGEVEATARFVVDSSN